MKVFGGKNTGFDSDREYNPYFNNVKNEDDVDVNDYLEKMNGVKIEGESERDRQKRLKRNQKVLNKMKSEKRSSERKNYLGLDSGKKFRIISVAGIVSIGIFFCVDSLYLNYIRFPAQAAVNEKTTGLAGLEEWRNALAGYENGGISSLTGKESYLEDEIVYANGNETRLNFIKAVIGSVSYKPGQEIALNVYGNYMLNRDGDVVYQDSNIQEGEVVPLTYVDYSKIQLNEAEIKDIRESRKISAEDPNYKNELIDFFCEYVTDAINSGSENVLTTDENYVPNLSKGSDSTYHMSEEEDIYLDKLLFSSDDFVNLCLNFSRIMKDGNFFEPYSIEDGLPTSKEWYRWSCSPTKDYEEEPYKWDLDHVVGYDWCGAYHLKVELGENAVMAKLGDGTLEDPASVGTPVITDWVEDGVKYPIEVIMTEYGSSEDAIDWFESKDKRNRGYDIKSEVQYVYYVFNIRNMSESTITVIDDSSLCDRYKNLSARTGTVYGLQDSVTLAPGESGVIESWSNSIELNKKYIIWGKTYSKTENIIWFRKLMGDLGDKSWNKGVRVNTRGDYHGNEGETENNGGLITDYYDDEYDELET